MEMQYVCRACLCHVSQESNFSSVFSICTVPEFNQQMYSDLIMNCTNTQVKNDDNLPKLICNDCVAKLVITLNFKMRCESSYNYLLTCLSAPFLNPKLEDVDDTQNMDSKNWHGNYEYNGLFGDDKKREVVKLEIDIQQVDIPILPPSGQDLNDVKPNKNLVRGLKIKTITKQFGTEKHEMKSESKHKGVQEKKKRIRIRRQILEGGFKCNFCNIRYEYRYLTQAHEKSHYQKEKYYCELCEKYYRSEVIHSKYHSNAVRFECDYCGNMYKNRTGISSHIKIHQSKFDAQLYKCDVVGCGVSFSNRTSLTNHHKLVHEDERRHMCEVCSKTFVHRKGLTIHLASVHSDEKKYNCEHCDKKFKTTSSLSFHVRRDHLKLRPFECRECGKKFVLMCKLKQHELIHTQDYRFECDICSRRFLRSDNMLLHKRKMHGGSVMLCKYE